MHVGPLGDPFLLNLPVARICRFEAGLSAAQLQNCRSMNSRSLNSRSLNSSCMEGARTLEAINEFALLSLEA